MACLIWSVCIKGGRAAASRRSPSVKNLSQPPRLGSPRSATGRHAGRAEGLRRLIERKRREGLEIQFVVQRGGRKIGCQGKGAAGWAMNDAVTQSQGKMPEPRRLDLPLLPTGQGEGYYLERFMGAFGEVLLFSRNEASAK